MAEETKTAAAPTAAETVPGYDRPKGGVRPQTLVPLAGTPGDAPANMDLLFDVAVPVVAQLGSTEMRIRDILKLGPGAIVELDKLAGEPVDLLVRGQLFAQGEVVVVDDSFGIRVTRIISPNDRAESGPAAQ